MTVTMAVDAVGKGFLLKNVLVKLLIDVALGHGHIRGHHIAIGCIVHKPR